MISRSRYCRHERRQDTLDDAEGFDQEVLSEGNEQHQEISSTSSLSQSKSLAPPSASSSGSLPPHHHFPPSEPFSERVEINDDLPHHHPNPTTEFFQPHPQAMENHTATTNTSKNTRSISQPLATALVVNYVGAGYILLPYGFAQAGPLLGTLVLGLVCTQAYITSLFVLHCCQYCTSMQQNNLAKRLSATASSSRILTQHQQEQHEDEEIINNRGERICSFSCSVSENVPSPQTGISPEIAANTVTKGKFVIADADDTSTNQQQPFPKQQLSSSSPRLPHLAPTTPQPIMVYDGRNRPPFSWLSSMSSSIQSTPASSSANKGITTRTKRKIMTATTLTAGKFSSMTEERGESLSNSDDNCNSGTIPSHHISNENSCGNYNEIFVRILHEKGEQVEMQDNRIRNGRSEVEEGDAHHSFDDDEQVHEEDATEEIDDTEYNYFSGAEEQFPPIAQEHHEYNYFSGAEEQFPPIAQEHHHKIDEEENQGNSSRLFQQIWREEQSDNIANSHDSEPSDLLYYEISYLAQLLLGRRAGWFFTLTTALDLFAISWTFCSVFGQAMAREFPLLSDENDDNSSTCAGLSDYQLYILLFMVVAIPLSCTNLLDQLFLQMAFLATRLCMVLVMIITLIHAHSQPDRAMFRYGGDDSVDTADINYANIGQGRPASPSEIPLVQWSGLLTMIELAVFSTAFQFCVPNIFHLTLARQTSNHQDNKSHDPSPAVKPQQQLQPEESCITKPLRVADSSKLTTTTNPTSSTLPLSLPHAQHYQQQLPQRPDPAPSATTKPLPQQKGSDQLKYALFTRRTSGYIQDRTQQHKKERLHDGEEHFKQEHEQQQEKPTPPTSASLQGKQQNPQAFAQLTGQQLQQQTYPFRFAVVFIFFSNLCLSLLQSLYFGKDYTDSSSNLNWFGYRGRLFDGTSSGVDTGISTESDATINGRDHTMDNVVSPSGKFVVLFAALDGLAVYPLLALSLGDILRHAYFGPETSLTRSSISDDKEERNTTIEERISPKKNDQKRRIAFRLLGSIPPAVASIFMRDLPTLASLGVIFTLLSYTAAPALLYLNMTRRQPQQDEQSLQDNNRECAKPTNRATPSFTASNRRGFVEEKVQDKSRNPNNGSLPSHDESENAEGLSSSHRRSDPIISNIADQPEPPCKLPMYGDSFSAICLRHFVSWFRQKTLLKALAQILLSFVFVVIVSILVNFFIQLET